jgi:hypothetical protein
MAKSSNCLLRQLDWQSANEQQQNKGKGRSVVQTQFRDRDRDWPERGTGNDTGRATTFTWAKQTYKQTNRKTDYSNVLTAPQDKCDQRKENNVSVWTRRRGGKSNEVKNEWSCTSPPPIQLQELDRDKFLHTALRCAQAQQSKAFRKLKQQ